MRKHLSFRIAARLGTAVMAAILIGMAAAVIATLVWSHRELNQLRSAIGVSNAYQQTALSAAFTSIYWTEYGSNGDDANQALLRASLAETLRLVEHVNVVGTDEDRAFLAQLSSEHAAELALALQAIQDLDSGTFSPESATENTRLADITRALTDAARDRRDAAIANLDTIESTTSRLSIIAFVVIAIGMPVVAGIYVITRRYDHKETVREMELQRLAQAALTDGLTGLANHRAFQEDLRLEVARAARHERAITVAMMDVDDFKEVNDTAGHAVGDAVLADFAGLLEYVRGADRAYRVGGDEFALIMPETNAAAATQALERLRASAEMGLRGTSVSIGFATAHEPIATETLRDRADLALYEAKRRGKNQVTAYHPDLSMGVEVTTAKTQALRRALDAKRVTMWYQPIYHYNSQQLLAFEALMRLPQEPEIEGPEDAFRIANSLGKTRELDMLCIAEALRSASDLPAGVKLFINIDPATLTNSRFSVDELEELVIRSRFETSQVVFEVTERTMASVRTVQQQVEAIRAKGFGMALDDVGTGNAGLELMRMVKFDFVKIDRSVIIDASQGGQGRAVILAIVAFARETGAFMIAEGIEDSGVLKAIRLDEPGLRDFWVRGVQGFLLGEPRASLRSFLQEAEDLADVG